MNNQFDEITVSAINSNIKYVKPGETIQGVIDSITDAAVDNPYVVIIPPGVYIEGITMKEWVNLRGFGRGVSIISFFNTKCPTITLAPNISIDDVSIIALVKGMYISPQEDFYTNMTFRNCNIEAGAVGLHWNKDFQDSRFINCSFIGDTGMETICGGATGTLDFFNCNFETTDTAVWSSGTVTEVSLFSCKINGSGDRGLVASNEGILNVYNCSIIMTSGNGVECRNETTTNLFGGEISGGVPADINQIAGTCQVNVYGTKYDTSIGTLSGDIKVPGKLNVGGIVEYTDNTAALAGGLVAGDFYRTGDVAKVVH